jgi:signal transduction histidine kinase
MSKLAMSLLLLSFSFLRISAQRSYADSLKQALTGANEDTSKVLVLISLGGFYRWSYPDSGILYTQEALKLAQKLNFVSGELSAYGASTQTFSGTGNYPKALEAGLKALELSEKLGDSTRIIWAYANIGSVYYYSNDFERALYYFNKLKLNHAVFLQYERIFSGFLGETYFHLTQLDSAFYYTKISYDLDLKSDNHWPTPYFYLGEIYAQKKEYASALDYYHKGIDHSTEKLELLDGYIGIAGVFKKMNLTDSVVYYNRLAVGVVHDGSFPSKIAEASKILTNIYMNSHVNDSALKYMQIMMIAKDSLFSQAKQNLYFNEQSHQQELQQKIQQQQLVSKNRQNMIFLLSGLIIVLVVAIGLWRRNIYKQRSYLVLEKQKQEIDIQKAKTEKTLEELRTTQTQLIQQEKMVSLGELTAGIAHEIQNPLNFVNNFSEINKELLSEMNDELDKENIRQAKAISRDIIDNEEKIITHGKRADAIVKNMLQHSRAGSGQKEPTDINVLADEYLRLAYHGLRAKDKSFNATTKTEFDNSIGKINVGTQEIGRVILNLINNAFYAVNEKQKQNLNNYEPTVVVGTLKNNGKVEIKVKDNGNGIPQKVLDKIFLPFFTTKPTGQGTGLGLSLSYDIITKGHGGELKVETKEGEGSQFTIILPAT